MAGKTKIKKSTIIEGVEPDENGNATNAQKQMEESFEIGMDERFKLNNAAQQEINYLNAKGQFDSYQAITQKQLIDAQTHTNALNVQQLRQQEELHQMKLRHADELHTQKMLTLSNERNNLASVKAQELRHADVAIDETYETSGEILQTEALSKAIASAVTEAIRIALAQQSS